MADELSEADFEPSSQSAPAADTLSLDDFATGGVRPEGGDALQSAQSGTTTPTGAEPQTLTIRDYLASNGIDTRNHPDDYTALNYLIAQSREAERLRQAQAQIDAYAQIGRTLAPQGDKIAQFLQQGQQPQARKPWEPPPFNEGWVNLVTQDPASGVYVGKPGTPANIVQAVNDYADWQKAFTRNPAAVMQQYAESREQAMVEKIQQQFEQRLAARETEYRTREIVAQNSPWFYAKDQQGNYLRDPISGQPVATPLGQQYIQMVRYADSIGVKDPAAKDALAKMILRNELAAAQNPQPTNQNAPTPAQQRALAAARGNRNPLQALGAQERRESPRATEPDQVVSLDKMLRERLQEAGVTDKDFAWN